ncbi:hypothetical protein K435DRAFT_850724 [Dendrothele bispora CBS 962.96]|uniref:Uncharacterized protein n=1 Tax=Dendrothele bispora (strain CBS 962.96) TaxID=1314807 RepID=A0A4S8MPY9_DENBC|nr:hypothetical protein K435DRAFT_850724 [Dendrothele bispora CBS 962.96]
MTPRPYNLSFAGENQAKLFQIVYNGVVPPEAHARRLRVTSAGSIFHAFVNPTATKKLLSWYSPALRPEEHKKAKKAYDDWATELKATKNKEKKQDKKAREKDDNTTKTRKTKTQVVVEIPKRVPQPFPMTPPSRARNATPGPSGRKSSPIPLPPTPPPTSPAKAPNDKGKRRAEEEPGTTPVAKRRKLRVLGSPIDLTDSEEDEMESRKAGKSPEIIDLTQD